MNGKLREQDVNIDTLIHIVLWIQQLQEGKKAAMMTDDRGADVAYRYGVEINNQLMYMFEVVGALRDQPGITADHTAMKVLDDATYASINVIRFILKRDMQQVYWQNIFMDNVKSLHRHLYAAVDTMYRDTDVQIGNVEPFVYP